MRISTTIANQHGISYINVSNAFSIFPSSYQAFSASSATPFESYQNDARIKILLTPNDTVSNIRVEPAHKLGFSKTGLTEIISTLQSFCHQADNVILTTHYMDEFNAEDVEQVATAINRYCSNATQTIDIGLPWEHKALGFRFTGAKTVYIWRPQRYTGMELETLFPAMETLGIDISTKYSLKHRFASLKSLKVKEKYSGNFDLKSFAKYNPHLRGLTLAFEWDIDYLHQVNELFPDLQSLDIKIRDPIRGAVTDGLLKVYGYVKSFFKKPANKIHLKTVKNFAIDIDKYHGDLVASRITSIEFDQLDSFKMVHPKSNLNPMLFDMIVKNHELISVDFTPTQLTNQEIGQFVDTLHRLEQCTFVCYTMTRAVEVLDLLEKTNVERVNLIVDGKLRHLYKGNLIGVWRVVAMNYTGSQYGRPVSNLLSFHRNGRNI